MVINPIVGGFYPKELYPTRFFASDSDEFLLQPFLPYNLMGMDGTWRIIPFSKWLVKGVTSHL